MRDLAKQLIYFAVLCTLFYAVNIAAEDMVEKTTKEQTANIEKKESSSKHRIGKRGQVKTLEEFIPSEEVSADKPVAFPNDI